jgi:hypothetical protein
MIGKIIIAKENIIKVSKIEKNILTGYDVFTEKLIQIENSGYIEITEQLIALLGSDELRIKLVNAMEKTDKEMMELLGMSDRNFYRHKVKYISQEVPKDSISKRISLNEKTISEIRDKHATKKFAMSKLASDYKLTTTLVATIVNRKGAYAKK